MFTSINVHSTAVARACILSICMAQVGLSIFMEIFVARRIKIE